MATFTQPQYRIGLHAATSKASSMQLKPQYPQFANIVFLDRVGQTLRWVTSDIPREELPDDIKRLLRRLERVEIRDARRKAGE
jgi:hypothetical protein